MFVQCSKKMFLAQAARRSSLLSQKEGHSFVSFFQRVNEQGIVSVARRHRHAAAAVLASSATDQQNQRTYAVVAMCTLLGVAVVNSTQCEEQPQKRKSTKKKKKNDKRMTKSDGEHEHYHLTPADVAVEDFGLVQKSHDIDSMPEFTSQQVAEYDGEDGKPIYMSYGGVVYDVTNFINNHPGGSEKILTASGQAIEPFWHIYRQHFASDLPIRLMEHMAVGRLKEEDQEAIEEQMSALQESSDDPYMYEPARDPRLIVHSDTPMNAECPTEHLTESYLTPHNLFYLRHHHPVPVLTPDQLSKYRVEIDVTAYASNKRVLTLTLDDLREMPKVEITSTLQCSGNRRGDYNSHKRTSGTPWGQGAISTAKWGGVRLKDVLKLAGLDDPVVAQEEHSIEHVRFESMDGMKASIPIEKAANPYGDVILAYEMNGEPLPRDHGGPLRVIVPGYSAVRSVKWVNKIEVAETEAEGPWQRGLNYKTLPPNVVDANDVELDKMPSMMEASVYSGITKMTTSTRRRDIKPGDIVMVKVGGWAWAGSGRNIVRVDLTSDGGKNWKPANLTEGSDQRFGRAWAWTFWEGEIPCEVTEDGKIEIASKAVDMAFNSQPDRSSHHWNVRGLGNNSWFRKEVEVC